MIERLEWITGPELVARPEMKMRRGVLTPTGSKRRYLVGQLRDRELGHIHGWAMSAPRSNWQTLVKIERLKLDIPKGKNWTAVTNKALAGVIPPGFTIPPDGSPFERGLII
jgi:hypothetical protein